MPLAAFPKCFLDDLCVTGRMTAFDWIETSSALDLDGLEFYWNFIRNDTEPTWDFYRLKVEEQQRRIPMLCYSPDFTQPDADARRREIQAQKQAIHAASVLGADYCRVLSGQKRPDVSREQGLRWASESIQECLPDAERHGVALILENHYKDGFWDYPEFAQKSEDFLSLLERIPETEWFGVNYDPSNAVIAGEDPVELLMEVRKRVKTMHASDRYFEGGTFEDLKKQDAHPQKGYAEILKHGVIGRGMNDYDRIFSILKEENFDGWISIEDGPDPETGMQNLKDSIAFLRAKMRRHGLS